MRWQRVPGGVREARFARAEVQARLGRGELVLRSDRRLEEVGEEWLSLQHHLRPRTRALYESALARHVYPRLGRRRVSEVTVDRIAALVVDLQRAGLAGSTIRGIMTPLGRILSHAARRGLIPENPIARLERNERPRLSRREMRILDREEIAVLLDAVIPSYRAAIATAIFTGLRQGELLGLAWADVDFAAQVIRVRRQLDRTGALTEPKTPKALREVNLIPSLARLLREHKLASPYSAPGDFVFATRTGGPIYYRNLSRRGLSAAVAKTGLDRAGEPRLRFHDLRHTYASLLVAEGLNVVYVSRQLGHASASFTLDVYSHLFDRAEHGRRAAAALETTFGALLRPRPGLGSLASQAEGISAAH